MLTRECHALREKKLLYSCSYSPSFLSLSSSFNFLQFPLDKNVHFSHICFLKPITYSHLNWIPEISSQSYCYYSFVLDFRHFVHSFIFRFLKNIYYVTGTVLGSGGKEMNKIKPVPSSNWQYVCSEIINVNQVVGELRGRGDKLCLNESGVARGVAVGGWERLVWV